MEVVVFRYFVRKGFEYMKEIGVQESDEEQYEDKLVIRKELIEILRIKYWNRSNWFKEVEKLFRYDKEL